jgi:two-component system chemotaxis response regulator CheY
MRPALLRDGNNLMGAPLKILAVDDEPSIAQSMRFIFERPLYELASAQDGEAALARLTTDPNSFDVIITDNNMPGVSGIQLVRQLRDRGFLGKIMVLSAHLSPEVRAAYEAMKVDAMIDKPFSIKALRQTLDQVAA